MGRSYSNKDLISVSLNRIPLMPVDVHISGVPISLRNKETDCVFAVE